MKRTPFFHIAILIAFLMNSFGPIPKAYAQDFVLPKPGVMVHLSPPLNPPMLKGIKVDANNPFRFDFIMDVGDGSPVPNKDDANRLIKYFLASLTTPEQDLWVNLSPYEKDRIIPNSFGLTEMGRDLLAEDYMLKQITASLIYPEDEVGKKFWKRIYEESAKKYGTTNIPVNTFNKVWIVPERAVVYENAKAGTAYVVESKLKVMLEGDYLSMQKHGMGGQWSVISDQKKQNKNSSLTTDHLTLATDIIREIVIPELTKEINENQNFAQLRQVYNSLILATWYKKKIKDSILSQVYANKNKTAGIQYVGATPRGRPLQGQAQGPAPTDIELIYQQYLSAFKKGVYNYIKEEIDPQTQQPIPRKYFSGGLTLNMDAAMKIVTQFNIPNYSSGKNFELTVDMASVAVKQPEPTTSSQERLNVKDQWIDRKELNTTNPYLLRAVDYFNQEVIGEDPKNISPITWEKVIRLYERFRGDNVNPEYLSRPEERTQRLKFKLAQKIIDRTNQKFDDPEQLMKAAADLYAEIVDGQIFIDQPGFRVIREISKIDPQFEKHPAEGHHRLAYFLAIFMLVNNGHRPFYFWGEYNFVNPLLAGQKVDKEELMALMKHQSIPFKTQDLAMNSQNDQLMLSRGRWNEWVKSYIGKVVLTSISTTIPVAISAVGSKIVSDYTGINSSASFLASNIIFGAGYVSLVLKYYPRVFSYSNKGRYTFIVGESGNNLGIHIEKNLKELATYKSNAYVVLSEDVINVLIDLLEKWDTNNSLNHIKSISADSTLLLDDLSSDSPRLSPMLKRLLDRIGFKEAEVYKIPFLRRAAHTIGQRIFPSYENLKVKEYSVRARLDVSTPFSRANILSNLKSLGKGLQEIDSKNISKTQKLALKRTFLFSRNNADQKETTVDSAQLGSKDQESGIKKKYYHGTSFANTLLMVLDGGEFTYGFVSNQQSIAEAFMEKNLTTGRLRSQTAGTLTKIRNLIDPQIDENQFKNYEKELFAGYLIEFELRENKIKELQEDHDGTTWSATKVPMSSLSENAKQEFLERLEVFVSKVLKENQTITQERKEEIKTRAMSRARTNLGLEKDDSAQLGSEDQAMDVLSSSEIVQSSIGLSVAGIPIKQIDYSQLSKHFRPQQEDVYIVSALLMLMVYASFKIQVANGGVTTHLSHYIYFGLFAITMPIIPAVMGSYINKKLVSGEKNIESFFDTSIDDVERKKLMDQIMNINSKRNRGEEDFITSKNMFVVANRDLFFETLIKRERIFDLINMEYLDFEAIGKVHSLLSLGYLYEKLEWKVVRSQIRIKESVDIRNKTLAVLAVIKHLGVREGKNFNLNPAFRPETIQAALKESFVDNQDWRKKYEGTYVGTLIEQTLSEYGLTDPGMLHSEKRDNVQLGSEDQKTRTGGIDLTPANMNLQTQGSNGEIKFNLDPVMLKQLQNAPGFYPVIIRMQPLTDLKGFLGITTNT